ncbi:hypothetical protein Tco_0062730, partial [Tanacetum coccineum]
MSLHNPMKRIKVLCDGCVRPIVAMPFYKCSQECSNFVLHEWFVVYLAMGLHTAVTHVNTASDVHCGIVYHRFTHEAQPSMTFYASENDDFCLDMLCSWNLPKTIRHKYDKHPLKLSYSPVKNHKGQYTCEVCEEDLNPEKW